MAEVVSSPYRRTGVAVVTALLLFIPGVFIGGVVALIYKAFLGYMLTVLSWLPFYHIIETVELGWFGGLLHGFVAAAVAIGGSVALFKQANVQAGERSSCGVFDGSRLDIHLSYHPAI